MTKKLQLIFCALFLFFISVALKNTLWNQDDDIVKVIQCKSFFEVDRILQSSTYLNPTYLSKDLRGIIVKRKNFTKLLANLVKNDLTLIKNIDWPSDKILSPSHTDKYLNEVIDNLDYVDSCTLLVNIHKSSIQIHIESKKNLTKLQKKLIQRILFYSPYKTYEVDIRKGSKDIKLLLNKVELFPKELLIKQELFQKLNLYNKNALINVFHDDATNNSLRVQIYIDKNIFPRKSLTLPRKKYYSQIITQTLQKFDINNFNIDIQLIPLINTLSRYEEYLRFQVKVLEAKVFSAGLVIALLALILYFILEYRKFRTRQIDDLKNNTEEAIYSTLIHSHEGPQDCLIKIQKHLPKQEFFQNHSLFVRQTIHQITSHLIQLSKESSQPENITRYKLSENYSLNCDICKSPVEDFFIKSQSLKCPNCQSTYSLCTSNLLTPSTGPVSSKMYRNLSIVWISIFVLINVSVFLYLSLEFRQFQYSLLLQGLTYFILLVFSTHIPRRLPILYLHPTLVKRTLYTFNKFKIDSFLTVIILSIVYFLKHVFLILNGTV